MIELIDHLESLEENGELVSIEEEVDWNLQVAAIASMANRTGAQAIHFKKIKGYPEKYTIAANLLSGPGHHYSYKRTLWGRMAIAMGLDPKIDYEKFIKTYNDRFENPIMPVKLTEGDCQEVVEADDDVDLYKFPFPYLHKEDGGRYGFGTLILKDPDSSWQNWGVYRFMIADHNTIVADFLTEPSLSRDTKEIYRKYCSLKTPMPFAIAIGGPPALTIAGASGARGVSEAEIAGGLNLDPINLVKAEKSDLLVPADAEMIIEGEISPHEMIEEGPYGSIRGYSERSLRPVMKVTAITHKDKLIIPVIVDGTKVSDTQAIISITESARLMRMGRKAGMLLRWIQIPPEWNLSIGIAAVHNPIHGITFRVARYLFAITNLFDKLILVDADVFPSQLVTVIGDWAHKSNPIDKTHLLDGYPPAVMPYYRDEVEDPLKGRVRMYIDACWPPHWGPDEKPAPISFEHSFSKELQESVLKRWKEEFKIPVEPFVLPENQR